MLWSHTPQQDEGPMTRCLWSIWAHRSSFLRVRKAVLVPSGWLSGLTSHCRTKEPDNLEGLPLSPDVRREQRPIWRQVCFSAQRPVSTKTRILRIQVLLIWTLYVASKQGRRHLSELGKYKIDNFMCLNPWTLTPGDRSSISFTRNISTNPTSFPAAQKLPNWRENFGCQGTLTPEQLVPFQIHLSPEEAQMF